MVSIIRRSQWGARAPKARSFVSWSRRVEFTLHYSTGSTSQTLRSIQNFHMDVKGWSDVGYNFLVDKDGRIYEGRGWTVLGAHAYPRNPHGVGVCFIGDDNMTDAAKRAVIALYDEANRRAGRTLTRKGHKDINKTSCPGSRNYSWWKSKNYRNVAGGGGSPAPYPSEPVYRREDRDGLLEPFEYGAEIEELQRKLDVTVDGFFGPVTERAVRAYQTKHGLAVDGIAGPETLGHLGLVDAPDAPAPTKPTPPKAPRPKPPTSKAPTFPLPRGWYFGPRSGPTYSVSGYFGYGGDLERWQRRMRDRGWTISVDGRYGSQTAGVAEAFQREKGLTVDSLIGPQTWKAAWEAPVT